MADNKVQYGLKNIYYAKITKGDSGINYSKPVAWPGAKNLKIDPSGDTNTFYADDMAYFTTSSANGYSGSLEVAEIPESMLIDVFGYKRSENGMLVEVSNAQTADIALLFECQGDVKARRHIFFQCTLGRPSFEANTKEDKTDPDTKSLDITVTPIKVGDDEVAKASASKGDAAYDTFFTAAPTLPTFTSAGVGA